MSTPEKHEKTESRSCEETVAQAQAPIEHGALKVTAPKDSAAGVEAVFSTVKHAQREMGLISGLSLLSKLNQKDGFSCPGCAWPDPKERSSIAEYCENGAKAVAEEATRKALDAEFFRQHSVEELAAWSDFRIGKSGRLTQPMIKKSGSSHYESLTWEQAFDVIATHLRRLDSPDEAAFYTSGRTSNEAAFLYQLFVRMLGTNNLPDCSNLCHESSGAALTETLGIGKGSVTLEDFERAELILVVGQNPGTNHPRMLSALEKAKRNGCHIVSINPLPEAGLKRFKNPQRLSGYLGGGTQLADMHLPVKINGDVPLLKGVLKCLLAGHEQGPEAWINEAFIEDRTEGYEAFVADLKQESFDLCVEESGITLEQMEELAALIGRSQRIICCWAMGLTQHKNAVSNIQLLVNLLLLKGSIGIPGGGTCPVRGHSNVQGDRTMGIWEIPQPAFMEKLKQRFAFEPPMRTGYNTVQAIKAMHAGKVRFFMSMGGNLVSAGPDTEYTAAAIRQVDLTVCVSTKLNRAHLVTGREALILPCLVRSERDVQEGGVQFVSLENSMSIVQSSEGRADPISDDLLSESAIVAGIAERTLSPNGGVDWLHLVGDYDRIRDHIEATIPGFDRYNERVRQPDGFTLPNCNREGRFDTDTGKAKFTVHAIESMGLAADEYLMMTIRSHDQYNTTIYGMDDRYRGVYNDRRVVFMNKGDVQRAGLTSGEAVDIVNRHGGQERVAVSFLVVPYPIPPQCIATYFPEANVLVPIDSTARKSHTPTSKSVVVTLRPSTVTP
ncbi:MAG: FdhF/YdeP family oxidoreductase [Planctomycetes bacterium]|nr:FdhF/YdeP family oxidoreductase [Planctomycetota bacterium]